jgi:anti-sigma B factor antagonist
VAALSIRATLAPSPQATYYARRVRIQLRLAPVMALVISVSAPDGAAPPDSSLPAASFLRPAGPVSPGSVSPGSVSPGSVSPGSVSPAGAVVTVAVAGELDLATAPELLNRVTDLIEAGHHRVVLDLRELTFCDSAGLSVLARIRKRVAQFDGALTLARPTSIVRSVLELTGMTEVIPTFQAVEEAVAAAAA